MIVIDTDTGYHIKYIILTNGLRLHAEDREMTLRMRIMNIATEVSEEDKNSERGHCLNWYTVNKITIEGHQWWRWGRSYVNDKKETKYAEEVNIVCYKEIQ